MTKSNKCMVAGSLLFISAVVGIGLGTIVNKAIAQILKPPAKEFREKHAALTLNRDGNVNIDDFKADVHPYWLNIANKSRVWSVIGIKVDSGRPVMLPTPIGTTCTEDCSRCLEPPKAWGVNVTPCNAGAYSYVLILKNGAGELAQSSQGQCRPDCGYKGETACLDIP